MDKEIEQIKDWSFGRLPEMLELKRHQQILYGYPALLDRNTHCEIQVFDDPDVARKTHYRGLRRLFALAHKDSLKMLTKQLPGAREIGLLFMQMGTVEEVMQQIFDFTLERGCLFEPLPQSQEDFQARVQVSKTKLSLIAQDIARQVLHCLEGSAELQKKLAGVKSLCPAAFDDMNEQFRQLIHRQFLEQTPYEQIVHIPRYLKGILVRIEKLRSNLVRDQEHQLQWMRLQKQYLQLSKNRINGSPDRQISEIRWQLEELRVALFAQELKTPAPMSVKRIEKILNSFRE
jgi:ATP-dependent helicase HrpA